MMKPMWSRTAAALLAVAAGSLGAAGAVQAAQEGPVEGLIVRLRNAPAHEAVAREQAQSAGGRSARGEAHRERLQQVLHAAAVDRAAIDVPSAPAVLPVGSASQLLRYDRPLTAEQAERLMKRLSARADVLWVEPNVRERLLQSANPPTDPLYAASGSNGTNTEGQWWLFTAGGTNGSARTERRRGVPDFLTAWSTFSGGSTPVTVAVLDTGITPHTDLGNRTDLVNTDNRVLTGYDFVTEPVYEGDGTGGRDNDPSDPGDFVSDANRSANPGFFTNCGKADSSWHGTKIAGLIAALTNNGTGVASVNWNARILPVRVAGKCGGSVTDIADGIRWAAGLAVSGVPTNQNPAKVINISFGGTAACSSEYQAAIDDARKAGAVVVTAAGNEHTAPTRPANCSNVIGVGALNRDGFKTTYSNFGPQLVISTVGGDASGLGGNWDDYVADTGLLTISNSGTEAPGAETYANVTGTSFSAPLVSATISLMLGRNAALTADQITEGLRLSARPHVTSAVAGQCSSSNPGRCICTTSTCGAGILDAPQALAYAANPGGYVAPALVAVNVDASDLTSAISAKGQDRSANSSSSTPVGPCGRDGVCGGATQPLWLLGLLAAAAVLRGARRQGRAAAVRAR